MSRTQNILPMAARHDSPWVPGLSAIAHLVLGNQAAAEAEFATRRANLTPRIGDYLTARTEELERLIAAFYRREHRAVAVAAAALPRRFWSFSSIPAARSLMELGRLNEANEQLAVARICRLAFPGPEVFEEHSGLHAILAEFYQGKLAGQQGRRGEARRWLETFLRRFPLGREPLPQIKEARSLLAQL